MHGLLLQTPVVTFVRTHPLSHEAVWQEPGEQSWLISV